MSLEQLALFTPTNPLRDTFAIAFFRALPATSGIYWMNDERGRLLYVGKAKNLRARISSYRHLPLEKQSPKIRRLLCRVREIQWLEQANETAALLTENAWLRALKPPMNTANVRPEASAYLALSRTGTGLELRFYFARPITEPLSPTLLAGPFKGIARMRRSHAALARWIWSFAREQADWPLHFFRPGVPLALRIDCAQERAALTTQIVTAFLMGFSALPEFPLPEDEPSILHQLQWRNDSPRLQGFFLSCQRLQTLRTDIIAQIEPAVAAQYGFGTRLLEPFEVDDLSVMAREIRLAQSLSLPIK